MIRVALIDSSAVIRQEMGALIDEHEDMSLALCVADTNSALTAMQNDWPDVVLLELSTGDDEGLLLIDQIMATRPTPIILFSSTISQISVEGIDALQRGAFEIIKRSELGPNVSLSKHWPALRATILAAVQSKIHQLKLALHKEQQRRNPSSTTDSNDQNETARPTLLAPINRRAHLVAIGASTGGTIAVETILSQFTDTSMPPIVIAQHMPKGFTQAYAHRLNKLCQLTVVEASDGMMIETGHVYLAPGGHHLTIERDGLNLYAALQPTTNPNQYSPSVDALFMSVAAQMSQFAVGIVLTGMGRDGAQGLKLMHDRGAQTLAQDEASSVVFGMPAAAIALNAVSKILPLDTIATHSILAINGDLSQVSER